MVNGLGHRLDPDPVPDAAGSATTEIPDRRGYGQGGTP